MQLRTWSAVTVTAMAIGAAGCGGSGNGNGNGGGSGNAASASSGSSGIDQAALDKAKALVAEKTKIPTIDAPTEPVTPKPGKTLGVVTCGNAAEPCLRAGEEARDAGKVIGWKTIIADGKLTPQGNASAVESLVRQGVDAILMVAVADKVVVNGLKMAKKAGIPVACTACGNPKKADVPNPSDVNIDIDFVEQGRDVASYAVAESGAKLKVALTTHAFNSANPLRLKGEKEVLDACKSCKVQVIKTENPSGGDINAISRASAQSILQQFPGDQLNWYLPVSDTQGIGAVQAIKASGRPIKTASVDCNPENLDLIRTGVVQQACANTPLGWMAWASVDQLLRLDAGDKPSDPGVKSYLVTKATAPASGQHAKEPDYQGYFTKLWTQGQ